MARRSYTVLQRVQHLRCICTCPPTTAMSNRNPDKFQCNAAALHTVGTRCCCRHAIKNNNRVVVKLALNAEINYLSARCAAREVRCMPGFIPRAVLLHLHRLTCRRASCNRGAGRCRFFVRFIGILRSLFFVNSSHFVVQMNFCTKMDVWYVVFDIFSCILRCFSVLIHNCCCILSWNAGIYALVSSWLIYRRFSAHTESGSCVHASAISPNALLIVSFEQA